MLRATELGLRLDCTKHPLHNLVTPSPSVSAPRPQPQRRSQAMHGAVVCFSGLERNLRDDQAVKVRRRAPSGGSAGNSPAHYPQG